MKIVDGTKLLNLLSKELIGIDSAITVNCNNTTHKIALMTNGELVCNHPQLENEYNSAILARLDKDYTWDRFSTCVNIINMLELVEQHSKKDIKTVLNNMTGHEI